MGKKGGSSWITAVKRAFRSPTKLDGQSRSTRPRTEHELDAEQEPEKKREKRRWLFRKPTSGNHVSGKHQAITATTGDVVSLPSPPDHKHAIAVAAATQAAAEAAVATAQAAVEIIRLTRPPSISNPRQSAAAQLWAAILIQTAFRGYLARKALVALRGIVKLQALIRGQNVRKQAKMTLRCMQALLRVQARVRDHRARLSHDGGRKSMFAETTNLWESKYLQDIRDRKSASRAGSFAADDYWNIECPRTLEELEAILQARKEAASQRESSLAYVSSKQDVCGGYDEKELDDRTDWLHKWMLAERPWDNDQRVSTEKQRESIKTVQVDSSKPFPSPATNNAGNSQDQIPIYRQAPQHYAASPRQTSQYFNPSTHVQPPSTPSPAKSKPLHLRSTSPRRSIKEERSYSTANTPNFRSIHRLNSAICRYNACANGVAGNVAVPNYMAATESAKARVRSQSAPRQRASTPERERGGLAKKRLSYPVAESPYSGGCRSMISQNLRSPSFKSLQCGYVGMEQQSNLSCYTDSIGGEISPCSTTDLRRWLR